jgi:hypothetical protein
MANDLAIYEASSELASKTSTFGGYLDKGGDALKNAFKDNDTVFSEDFSKILNGDVSTNEALVNSLMNDTTQIDSIATSFIDSFGEDTAAATAALAAFTGKTVDDITDGGDLTTQLSSFLKD